MAYGFLIPPQPDEIIHVDDSELGLLHQVKPSRYPIYLYASPPTTTLDRLVRHRDNYELVKIGEQEFPAALVGGEEEVVGIQQELKPGQRVIARHVPGIGKGVWEVVTFKQKGKTIDDMPESGSAIEVLNKGYVLGSHIGRDKDIAETFRRAQGDIFPNDDLVNDVKQSVFGDCFLLASILAILNKPDGEDYIKSMMVQQGRYTIVRLYDPNTLSPVYYRVENTLHHQNDKCTVKHNAPWVHILEKAYTAHALKKNIKGESFDAFYYSNPSFRDMFGDGGKPVTALMVLTGQEAREVNIHQAKSYPWDQEGLIYSMSVYNRVQPLVEYFDKSDPSVLLNLDNKIREFAQTEAGLNQLNEFAAVSADISGNDVNAIHEKLTGNEFSQIIFNMLRSVHDDEQLEMLHAVSHYVSEHIKLCMQSPLALSDALDSVSLIASMGKFVKFDLMMQGKWDEFERDINVDKSRLSFSSILASHSKLKNYALPQAVLGKFNEYIESNAQSENLGWDGELGTGLYSQRTELLFTELANHFNQTDEAVVASTRNTFPEKVPGLRPQHAYAATGVSEDQQSGLKYIHVRNPWGRMGRKYYFEERVDRESRGMSLAQEEGSEHYAESKIELSDFSRYFGDYSIGKFNPDFELQQSQHIQPKPQGFMQRHFSKIIGASVGTLIGAGIGAAIGFALLPFTFGISVPLFAAIGAAIGGALLGGMSGGLIGGAVDRKRNLKYTTYIPVAASDSDTESSAYSSDRMRSLSEDEIEKLSFNRDERRRHSPVADHGMFGRDNGKGEDEISEKKLDVTPRRKK